MVKGKEVAAKTDRPSSPLLLLSLLLFLLISRLTSSPPQVPEGATPRTVSIHLRGEVCRSMKPGDVVVLTGIFLPEPVQGFRAMRAGLLTTTYILVGGRGGAVQGHEGRTADYNIHPGGWGRGLH